MNPKRLYMSEGTASKLPSRSVVLALMKKSVATKEQTSKIAGEFGDRVKAQVDNGNLDAGAFRVAAGIYRLAQNNEIRAKDRISHIRVYLEWIEEELHGKGHVGNIDDMARAKPTAAEAMAGVSEPAAPAATDGLSSAEALQKFREANEASGMVETAPAEPAKAKPGRKPKLKVVESAPEPEAAEPPAPPVNRLDDDDDWNGSAPTPPEPALAGAMH